MEIWVILEGSGEVKTYPDRARIRRGQKVRWRFQAPETPLDQIAWSVYFEEKSPLRGTHRANARSKAERQSEPYQDTRQHLTQTHAKIINGEPGEYKYGIKATDLRSNQTLADEDPYIIVL